MSNDPRQPRSAETMREAWQKLRTDHEACYAKYQTLRTTLATQHPEFALTRAHLDVEVTSLTQALESDAALVLLFTVPATQERPQQVMAWILCGTQPRVVALPELDSLLKWVEGY